MNQLLMHVLIDNIYWIPIFINFILDNKYFFNSLIKKFDDLSLKND